MGILEMIMIGIGVAGDAFAVSVCKGVTSSKKLKTAIVCGIWFAVFQMLMPLIGYILGSTLYSYIEAFDHWIVFTLLVLIGANMIKEGLSNDDECECCTDDIRVKTMLPLALATSIDALAIGVSMAMVKANMYIALPIVGGITFTLCVVGGMLGQKIGEKNKKIATILAGVVLVLLGIKVLVEHMFF